MPLLPCIENRVSIRKFMDKEIDPLVLKRILDAGRRAPSAKNRQAWRFVAITDPDIKKKIEEAAYGQEHVGQAGSIIAACTTNIDYKMANGQLSYPVDLSFAVAFMMLQAEAEGLGSCVITTYDEREIKDLLTVPFSMRIVMLLLVGHPKERPPINTPRKALDKITAYNHW